jgi:ParB-like chromosome segregation protein Spo0J
MSSPWWTLERLASHQGLGPLAELVATGAVRADPAAWPREGLDTDRVGEFAELYAADGINSLPPLSVIRVADGFVLADGWHRLAALERLGASEVPIVEVDARGRDAYQVAFEEGLRTAARQSLPLTRAEKQAAIQRLLVEGGRSDRQIAELVGVAHTTVGRIRSRPEIDAAAQVSGFRSAPSADDVARAFARWLQRLHDNPALGDLFRGDRTGRRMAAALEAQFGDDALKWAERLATWASDAEKALRGPSS